MSRTRAPNKQYKPTAQLHGDYLKDVFGSVYFSMVTSDAWKALKPNEKECYILCRIQASRKESIKYLYECVHDNVFSDLETEIYKDGKLVSFDYFTFPDKHAQHFGKDAAFISRHTKGLEEHGFIDKLRRENFKGIVFRFSDRWKTMK